MPVKKTIRYCGFIDAKQIGLVTSIERIVEFVFMQALAYPNTDSDDDDINCSLIKSQLLPGLRSFCSALRVCEQICANLNVFEDGKILFTKTDNNPSEMQELAKDEEFCSELEQRVLAWIKDVAKILMESEQLRKENDTSGPQDELEYWKKRAAQFSQLLANLEVNCLAKTLLLSPGLTENAYIFCRNGSFSAPCNA